MSQEAVLHRGPLFDVGEVRCSPDDADLAVLGPILGWCLSFPRLPLELRARGRSGFVADGSTALLLAPGARLDRKPLSGAGSRCQWIVISDVVVGENRALRKRLCDDLFARHASIGFCKTPALALLERRLFRRATEAPAGDADLSELACSVVDCALETRDPASPALVDSTLAEAARAILAADPVHAPRSDALAARLGVSVFHLCRSFRRATGQTLQEYSRRLRLELALEQLAQPDVDLSTLAFELGFSSHSHFTALFRKVFGLSPSAYRERRRRRRSIA
jgi:AraC-like DNA-binding protein